MLKNKKCIRFYPMKITNGYTTDFILALKTANKIQRKI